MSQGCRQLLSVLLALFFVLSLLASSVNVAQASQPTTQQDYVLLIPVPGADNITSQSDNIPRTILISGYDETGKMIEDGSNVITLTPEQLAEIDRLMEQYIERYNKQFDPNHIRFGSGYIISVTAGMIDASILENGKTSGNDYYVIQFYTDMADLDKETRETLNQIGCILYDYVPNYAFYANIPPEALNMVISLVNSGKVRYLGRIPTEAKISPELMTEAQQNPNNSLRLNMLIFKDTSASDIAKLRQLMQIYYEDATYISGEASASNVKDIIALNFVQWVEKPCRPSMSSQNNDGTSAAAIPEEYREYLVVLNTESAEYRNQVLAINGVEHIDDAIYTNANNEEYPAIAISANEQAADEIKKLDFVIAVSPIAGISLAPITPPNNEATKTTNNTMPIVIAGIVAILALALVTIVYLLKRRGSHA